jgi:hypothetical protein
MTNRRAGRTARSSGQPNQARPGVLIRAAGPCLLSLTAIIAGTIFVLPWFVGTGPGGGPTAPVAGAMDDPSGPSSAEPSATDSMPTGVDSANQGPCYEIVGYETRLAQTATEESAHADVVVTGTITGVSKGRWATADGKAPVMPEGRHPSVYQVYRLVTVQVKGVGKAGSAFAARIAVGRKIVVRISGGDVGCSSFRIAGQPPVTVGRDVAMFLISRSRAALAAAPQADFDVMDSWDIVDSAVIQPDGNKLSGDRFLSAAAAAP